MTLMETFLGTSYLLFVIIDPLGLVPVFLGLTHKFTPTTQKAIAQKAVLVASCLLLCFAFVGDFILDTLRISEPAFRIAGGILLLLTAIDMVTAHHLGFQGINEGANGGPEEGYSIAVFPLAIPLISGPGALISVVLAMRQAEESWLFMLVVIGSIVAILLLTYLCLRHAQWLLRLIGKTGANIITRVFGIMLAALAIQAILTAINALMIHPIFDLG